MPSPNVIRLVEQLANIHSETANLHYLAPNERLVNVRDLNLINEMLRYDETKVNLKIHQNIMANWGDPGDFLVKV